MSQGYLRWNQKGIEKSSRGGGKRTFPIPLGEKERGVFPFCYDDSRGKSKGFEMNLLRI